MTDRDDHGIAMRFATFRSTTSEFGGVAHEPERCRECGERVINRGAHAERCVGPRAHGKCDCPPGWKHQPDCVEVTGEAA